MATIIKERQRVELLEYELVFRHKDGAEKFGWYGFPCDKDGNLSPDVNPYAKENYERLMKKEGSFANYEFGGVVERKRSYFEPAILKCDCGEEFSLNGNYMAADECPACGRWFNMFGQRLNHPSTWED